MIKKVSSELKPCSRDLAVKFSEMQHLPGERLLRESRLKYFRVQLKQGRFNSPNWSVALIGDQQEPWRADGQHTSCVLATCEDELFPVDLRVTIQTYHLDTMAESEQLFDLFDNPMSARTNLDKLGIYVAQYGDELKDIDRKLLNQILSAVHWYKNDLSKQADTGGMPVVTFSPRERGLYLEEPAVRAFARWINHWHDSKHHWMFGNHGITAEIYADWTKHPALAGVFWGEVLTESNPDPNDDTRELATTFKGWHDKAGRTPAQFHAQAKKMWQRYLRIARINAPPEEKELAEQPPTASDHPFR